MDSRKLQGSVFILSYFIIFVNIIIYMPICILKRERERKGVDMGDWVSEENMGGEELREGKPLSEYIA